MMMQSQSMITPNIIIRNIRMRYPITSEQINDTFDEIYYGIVDAIGYQGENGEIMASGEIRKLWASLSDNMGSAFGASASGTLEAYGVSDGTFNSKWSSINSIDHKVKSMVNSPI